MFSYRRQSLVDSFEGNFGRTFAWVSAAHALAVLFLAVSGYLHFHRRPLEIVRVNLIEELPRPAPPPPTPAKPEPDPEPAPEPAPPDPEPTKPPEPKTVVPPPRPKPTPKPTPKPAKPKPKKKKKPIWKARSAEDIRKSAKAVTRARPRRAVPTIDPDKIANRIRRRVSRLNVVSAPSSSAEQPNTAQTQRYYALVGAKLHAAWDQPTRAAAGGGNPCATVRITVQPNGRVRKATLIKKSGIMAMDASVARLLKELDRLPPYSGYGIDAASLDINVVFELD